MGRTADLVEKRVGDVLASHPEAEVKRAMPIILLLLARDCGVDNLRPRVRDALYDLFVKLGVQPTMDDEEIGRRVMELVDTIAVDRGLLSDLEQVFATLDLGPRLDQSAKHYRLLAQSAPHDKAPRTTDVAPEDSERGAALRLRGTGRLDV